MNVLQEKRSNSIKTLSLNKGKNSEILSHNGGNFKNFKMTEDGEVKKGVITMAKRNARERNRVKQVNQGFLTLRNHIPDSFRLKKMSKVDTLKCAVAYIRNLELILNSSADSSNSESADYEPMELNEDNFSIYEENNKSLIAHSFYVEESQSFDYATSEGNEDDENSMSTIANVTSMSTNSNVTSMSNMGNMSNVTSMNKNSNLTSMSTNSNLTSMTTNSNSTSMSNMCDVTSMNKNSYVTSMNSMSNVTSMSNMSNTNCESTNSNATSMSGENSPLNISISRDSVEDNFILESFGKMNKVKIEPFATSTTNMVQNIKEEI